jgi:hypothetical protein
MFMYVPWHRVVAKAHALLQRMISAADVDLEGVEACGVGNQLRCVLPPRPLHDITRITSASARQLSEADVGIADGNADEEERCGLEKVAASTYCAALQRLGEESAYTGYAVPLV